MAVSLSSLPFPNTPTPQTKCPICAISYHLRDHLLPSIQERALGRPSAYIPTFCFSVLPT